MAVAMIQELPAGALNGIAALELMADVPEGERCGLLDPRPGGPPARVEIVGAGSGRLRALLLRPGPTVRREASGAEPAREFAGELWVRDLGVEFVRVRVLQIGAALAADLLVAFVERPGGDGWGRNPASEWEWHGAGGGLVDDVDFLRSKIVQGGRGHRIRFCLPCHLAEQDVTPATPGARSEGLGEQAEAAKNSGRMRAWLLEEMPRLRALEQVYRDTGRVEVRFGNYVKSKCFEFDVSEKAARAVIAKMVERGEMPAAVRKMLGVPGRPRGGGRSVRRKQKSSY